LSSRNLESSPKRKPGVTLYQLHYFPTNANAAPHMVLEEFGQKYDLVLVNRAKNAQKSKDYLKINPNGRIPTLVDGDLVMFEAAAIRSPPG
jgi:glutathione S-transferase